MMSEREETRVAGGRFDDHRDYVVRTYYPVQYTVPKGGVVWYVWRVGTYFYKIYFNSPRLMD